MAILGLGEVQFQAHRKDAAIHTWQALRTGRSSKADGSARLAEVLMEHDLLEEATAEVEQAEALEPKEPRHRRLMAQILERQRRPDAAIAEWERVMAMNVGPGHAAERREARSRILGILGREGRARLEDKIVKLRAEVSEHPERRETALFLAEAELRSDAITSAIDTLRATIARDRAHAAGSGDASDDAQAEVILTLVRLLRQTRQLDEAVRLLADLAQRIPSRAREAHIQIADIELGRYEDRQALDHASSAARLAPDDGRALIRIAEVQERAGEIDAALANYRRAFGRDANPTAAFALARLLTRRGSTTEAAEILRGVLRAATDEETITETGRRAIDLEEYLGTLDDLERVVSGLLFSNNNGAAYRRLLAEIYRRLLPALYRAPAEQTAAAENRARIAQHGLRPLLELVTEADGDPERGLIELLGMLGNRDAAPALARLAQGSIGSSGEALLRTSSSSGNETQLTAIIALGRLGDARARATLESLIAAPDTTVRVAAIWALGRLATPEAGDLLAAQTSSHLDVAGFAYLGLGRTGDQRWGTELAQAALDPSQPPRLRRAAAVALGLSRNRVGVPALMALLDSSSDELARAAAVALGALGDASLLPALFERALLAPPARTGAETPALAAIDRLIGNTPIEDEAKAIEGTRLDLEAMLGVLTLPPARVARGDRATGLDSAREGDRGDAPSRARRRPRAAAPGAAGARRARRRRWAGGAGARRKRAARAGDRRGAAAAGRRAPTARLRARRRQLGGRVAANVAGDPGARPPGRGQARRAGPDAGAGRRRSRDGAGVAPGRRRIRAVGDRRPSPRSPRGDPDRGRAAAGRHDVVGAPPGGRRDAGAGRSRGASPARGGGQGPVSLRALGRDQRRRGRRLDYDSGGGGCRPHPGRARRGRARPGSQAGTGPEGSRCRFRRRSQWRFRRSSSKLGPRLGSTAQGSLGPGPRCPGALRTLTCATGP